MKSNIQRRQFLHQYPELSGEEFDTAAFVKRELRHIGVDRFVEGFSRTSFVAVVEGKKQHGNVLFRCELDALPIDETNNFDYVSKVTGVSHKCGHDGHMSIMIGFAEELTKIRSDFGRVFLLFQSAEEIGQGAQEFVDSNFLDEYRIDFAFALHNVPGFDQGEVICKPHVFTPHVESLCIQLKGATSHAGEPDKGKNPLALIQSISSALLAMHQSAADVEDYFVVAPIFIEMGKRAYGTSAGSAEIGFTLRTFSSTDFEEKRKDIEQLINELVASSEIAASWNWLEPFYTTVNNQDAYTYIREAAHNLNFKFKAKKEPFDWGEDFGLITQKVKGALFGLGAGKDSKELHDAGYDFPDAIIPFGIALFKEINKQVQNDLQQ